VRPKKQAIRSFQISRVTVDLHHSTKNGIGQSWNIPRISIAAPQSRVPLRYTPSFDGLFAVASGFEFKPAPDPHPARDGRAIPRFRTEF
jgi:hypothetical protein